ncbi:uncharacterized protein N7483_000360 [Penicillium malachiteum]|uniref:uncharacterized protein n=1 Tax=Penicillium malachiteum TaxID=1324776 RepID=UPI0025473BE8|nr:uncharacterized protein N7483_000360 [Penicillium malachiteum]KAJ5735235.1 hypothetical protein N7483_000360 [Penicillium malachiteum]
MQETVFKTTFVYEEEKNGNFDRFLAVRCPKMDNPAITVKGRGHFACLHWVGLFLRTTKNNTNKFIAVRTTNRLLPDYAQRNLNKGYDWYEEDGPADITDRTVTLFPKQLYGTNGSERKLYDEFVTRSPNNKIGEHHFEMVNQMIKEGAALWAYKYMWAASGMTYVKTEVDTSAPIYDTEWLNYVTGIKLTQEPLNGWTVLLTIFTSVAKVAGVYSVEALLEW